MASLAGMVALTPKVQTRLMLDGTVPGYASYEAAVAPMPAERVADELHLRLGLRVEYLHSDIDALERVEILRRLRQGAFDCLVGINLLREGLDLPEVALVAILDADKEGFLRSETSLIQVAGRTARHVNGKVILYADQITGSMQRMLEVTEERRRRQQEYNRRHGITPRSVVKDIREGLTAADEAEAVERRVLREAGEDYDVHRAVQDLEREMLEAAEALEFERAAILRDELFELKRQTGGGNPVPRRRHGGRKRENGGRKRENGGRKQGRRANR